MLTNATERRMCDDRWMATVDFSSMISCWTREMLAESILADKENRAPSMDNVHPSPREIWGTPCKRYTPDELHEQIRQLQESVSNKR